jgi:hypothetical protein
LTVPLALLTRADEAGGRLGDDSETLVVGNGIR